MEIYLPVAEMSVHWLVIIALGAVVGFVSGMFGVGGGFLLTPLLMFYGIPSAVAVATTLSHITASSMSGALTQWRRRAIDFTMAGVMMVGGLIGTVCGVWLFALMRRQGQMDLIVSLTYVVLLGTIGTIMLRESMSSLRTAGGPAPVRVRTFNRVWMASLPLKMRFRQSRLYMSVIPPVGIGFVVGALGAIMGVGGGFIMVPALIYLLKVPTNVVIGTSLFQIIFTSAYTTLIHAATNQTVDIILAMLLMAGGVAGAQYGAKVGQKLRGEQLRALLALLVLAVAIRLAIDLFVRPPNLYSLSTAGLS